MKKIQPNLSYYKKALKAFYRFEANEQLDEKEYRERILADIQVKQLINATPGIFWIADLKKEGYIFVSESITSIMGYSPDEFYQLGLKKTVTLFPEEHNSIILQEIFPVMFQYFEQYSLKQKAGDVRACYSSLMKCSNGEYRWFYHQASILHTDENGVPSLMLKLLTDINPIKKDNGLSMSIAVKGNDGVYETVFTRHFVPGQSGSLSNREIEIMCLMSQGMTTIEIADRLSLSVHTVNNHRKNMIRKMEVKNSNELLIKATATGII